MLSFFHSQRTTTAPQTEVIIDDFEDDSDDNAVDGIIMVQKSEGGDGFYYDLWTNLINEKMASLHGNMHGCLLS